MGFESQRFVLEFVNCLRQHSSWTGRTHIQKAVFIFKALTGVELPFSYILYKHGPYSFDLDSEINDMLSYSAISEDFPKPTYGAQFEDGPNAGWLLSKFDLPKAIEPGQVASLAKLIGESDTRKLEKVATAAWIETMEKNSDDDKIASRLHELKPHISLEDAQGAVSDFRRIQADFRRLNEA